MRSMGIFGFLQWFFFVITKSGHEQFCIWLNKKGLGTRVRHRGHMRGIYALRTAYVAPPNI
jgi:hypothetical protein